MPNITFKAANEYFREVCIPPFPANQALPKWWTNHTPYVKTANNPDGKKVIIQNSLSNASYKKCVPMLDGLTSGYIISLWADVQLTQVDDAPLINWKVRGKSVFDVHGFDSKSIETPSGYHPQLFIYKCGWIPITPKGYSVLITHPFGYIDSPFRALSAVVDSDKNRTELSLPVWVKKDYEGIIEKGLPMVQLIPFKRENWTSNLDNYTEQSYLIEEDKNWNGTLVNHYVKKIWTKKSYK